MAIICRLSISVMSALPAYLGAVLTTYAIASISQSYFVLRALEKAGANLAVEDWLRTVVTDLYGMAFRSQLVSLLVVIALSFAVILPIASWLALKLRRSRGLVFTLVGAAMMAALLLLGQAAFFELSVFAGTRSTAGFISQVVAGGVGGWVYGLLGRKAHPETVECVGNHG